MMGTESASGTFPEATYILPLKWHSDSGLDDLAEYLGHVVKWVRVIVVDGSEPDLFENHAARFPSAVVHLRPVPKPGANGKVAGVLTGVHAARDELLVIADDDVRYERIQLEQVLDLLERADIVRPQNYLAPLPWHARLDTARSLVNRAFGADYPGTFALRRSVLMAAGGYDAHVLFENLELLRTIDAAGGREIRANDVFVRRLPPTFKHFSGQRVRQAYDDFAQPLRLAVELCYAPLILAGIYRAVRGRPGLAFAWPFAAWAIAEIGRRRDGGAQVFGGGAALWAPVWVLERAVSIWVAAGHRVAGGMPYAGTKLKVSAHSASTLRRRLRNRSFTLEPDMLPNVRGNDQNPSAPRSASLESTYGVGDPAA